MNVDTVLGNLEVPNDWISRELMNPLLFTLVPFLKMYPLLPHPLTWKYGVTISHGGKAGKKQTFHELTAVFKIPICFSTFLQG